MKNLKKYVSAARKTLEYYRNGPLGDIPSVSGKVVEEALRSAMEANGYGKVTTVGLIDLGAGTEAIQVKTHRSKSNIVMFCRSDKAGVAKRITDVKERIIKNMKKIGATNFYMLDVSILTKEFGFYKLAELKGDTLTTFGSFLKPEFVRTHDGQTHFKIIKTGLMKA